MTSQSTDLFIAETQQTPGITFNSEKNEWFITGRSFPKDPSEFYQPVIDWIANCENKGVGSCTFNFKLEFFNTCSSKVLLDILVGLRQLMEKGKTQLSAKWYYETDDEDMLENGQMFSQMSRLPLEIISY